MTTDPAPLGEPHNEAAAHSTNYRFNYGELPAVAQASFANLSEEQRLLFADEYNRHKKQVTAAYACWILLGCHYAYLGKWGLQVLLWILMLGCIGWAWWLIDVFRIPDMIRMHNQDAAVAAMQAVKTLGQ